MDSEKSMKKSFEEDIVGMSSSTSQENEVVSNETKKRAFLENLKKTPEEIESIANLTIGQRDNLLWVEERRKRLTASNFARIAKLRDGTKRENIVKDLLKSTFQGNDYTEYGIKNEVNAIKSFEKKMGFSVKRCGLFIHQDYPFLAASPDGLVQENAIVEVVCPYKAKDFTPENAIRLKRITFATLTNERLSLKKSDRHYYQMQGQLFVTGREFYYFVVWTPQGLLYETIERDEKCWNEMFPKLKQFYFDHLLPAILAE